MNSYDLLCLSRLYTWPGRLAFTLHISFLFCTILGRYVPYRGLAWSFGGLVWSSGVVLVDHLFSLLLCVHCMEKMVWDGRVCL
jgi:hypothetical protein